jgi:hypothetical protein
MSRLGLLACAFSLMAMARYSHAQIADRVVCVAPVPTARGCEALLESGKTESDVQVLVTSAGAVLPGVDVVFDYAGAPPSPPRVTTDPSGSATFKWSGTPPVTRKLAITARVSQPSAAAEVQIILLWRAVPLQQMAPNVLNDEQTWFTGLQLRHPILVAIRDATDQDCHLHLVAFRKYGSAQAAPDTVRARMGNPRGTGDQCYAQTTWKLDSDVGTQHLRAQLVGNSAASVDATATARRVARGFLGLGLVFNEANYDTISEKRDSIQVLRGDTTFFGAITSRSETRAKLGAAIRPYIGVDFPVLPGFRWLRWSIATSVKELNTFFWMGFSVLQLRFREHMEATGIDLHFGVFASRVQRLRRGANECGANNDICTKPELKFDRIGLMATFDASSLASAIASALGK